FPASLIFTGEAGKTPGSQDVQVANTSKAANSFSSGVIGAGLSNLPTNAVVAADRPTTVHVIPDFSKLTPGTYRGTITLQFSDGSRSQTISVLSVVAPTGTLTSNGQRLRDAEPEASTQAAICNPLQI